MGSNPIRPTNLNKDKMTVPYSTFSPESWDSKLPKQWRQWCRKARLKPHGYQVSGRKQYEWFNLIGHGRVWRVDCYGIFQVGDTIEAFDRWALCNPIIGVKIPKTEADFIRNVKLMLESIILEEYFKV